MEFENLDNLPLPSTSLPMSKGRRAFNDLSPNLDPELVGPSNKLAMANGTPEWATILMNQVNNLASDIRKSSEETKNQLGRISERLAKVEEVNKKAIDEIAMLKSENTLLQFMISKGDIEAERKHNNDIVFSGLGGNTEAEALRSLTEALKDAPKDIQQQVPY